MIIGAGVFGASTALELRRAGHRVIVVERSADGYCAPDAASNDLNKIIRADYSDDHYRDLAKTAISIWRRWDVLSPFYHETGVFFHTGSTSDPQTSRSYIAKALQGAAAYWQHEVPYPNQQLKPKAHEVKSLEEIQSCFPSALSTRLGPKMIDDITQSNGSAAYFNPRGGWGEANNATRAVLEEAKRLGVEVMAQAHVQSLLFNKAGGSRVIGVRCADGREFHISGEGKVVMCAGGWAERLLNKTLGEHSIPLTTQPTWSSAQCVLTVQLNEEQRRAFKGAPVILEFASGFYLFEPDCNGLLKMAIHSSGYRFPSPSQDTNAPRGFPTFDNVARNDAQPNLHDTHSSATPAHAMKKLHIPKDMKRQMLEQLRYVYPELADAPVAFDRVCFYSESLDENWIIDHVPNVQGLVLASGDSGHAFKFLPVLGNLVCARMGVAQAGTLTDHQKRVFSFQYHAEIHQQRSSSQRESSSFNARL